MIFAFEGDVVGPTLSRNFEYADTENVLRLSYGAAENVFFELGFNLQLLFYLRGAGYLPNDVMLAGVNYCSVVLQRGFTYFDNVTGAFCNFRDHLDKSVIYVFDILLPGLVLSAFSTFINGVTCM